MLGVLLGLDHVRGRFEHSARSRRVLAAAGAVCLVVGFLLAFRLVQWDPWWVVLFALALALPLFTLVAVITVEIWRLSYQQKYDAEISRLVQEQVKIIEQRDELQRRAAELRLERSRRSAKSDAGLFRQRQLKQQVESWASEGGVARIRSLRLEDWTRELQQLDRAELARRVEQLSQELEAGDSGADQEQVRQLRAQKAWTELFQLEAAQGVISEPDPGDLEARVEATDQQVERLASQLAEVQEELELWRGRRSFFRRQRLRLE